MMTESTYGVFAAFSMLVAYRLLDKPDARFALLLGALLGLAALARGEALLLLPLLLIPLLRRPGGLRIAAATCAMFVVVLVPWTVRNWSEFDRPVLVATEGGETLAGANCDVTYYGERIGTWQYSCARFNGRANEAKELNEIGHRGVRYARHHAGRVPLVLGARFARTWGSVGAVRGARGPPRLGAAARRRALLRADPVCRLRRRCCCAAGASRC